MDVIEGQCLSPKEFASLSREYHVDLKSVFEPPCLPAAYGKAEGKHSRELLAYLFFDVATEQWTLHAPDSATEEVEALFA